MQSELGLLTFEPLVTLAIGPGARVDDAWGLAFAERLLGTAAPGRSIAS